LGAGGEANGDRWGILFVFERENEDRRGIKYF
jgi:hypothetical protein